MLNWVNKFARSMMMVWFLVYYKVTGLGLAVANRLGIYRAKVAIKNG